MTTKPLAFRLGDEDIQTLDDIIGAGLATDRTGAIKRALATERRRLEAEHDAQIYATSGADPELTGLSDWAARQTIDLD